MAFAVTVIASVLALAASGGCTVGPAPEDAGPGLTRSAAWIVHPLLFLLGATTGFLTILRHREVDRRRWEIVQEPHLTKGEREWAHKEAERQRRVAGTVFVLAPAAVGFWLTYQFPDRTAGLSAADFQMITPLAGFLAGLLLALWRHRGERSDFDGE